MKQENPEAYCRRKISSLCGKIVSQEQMVKVRDNQHYFDGSIGHERTHWESLQYATPEDYISDTDDEDIVDIDDVTTELLIRKDLGLAHLGDSDE